MRALLEEHALRVWRFALRLTGDKHEAEDLTQEALLRAWRRRWHLRDPEKVRVWLFSITANLWRDKVRQRSWRPSPCVSPSHDKAGPGLTPDEQLIVQEDVKRAFDAMDHLPPRQRDVLYLHACEMFSIADIASVLAISSGAAKASLCLARPPEPCRG